MEKVAEKLSQTEIIVKVEKTNIMSKDVVSRYGVLVSPTPVQEFIEAIRKVGAGILADGEKMVKAEGVYVETSLIKGHAVEQIVKACREGKFDLVVMGARGLSRIKEMLLGSVSDGVTRHAYCPVLVVK
ncbi:MAG: universal stress protein [Candidatus Bathycorpusculaceae bacterium]